jgi:hypothetical protein
MFLDRGVNALGDFLAGQPTGDSAGNNANRGTDRAGDGTSGCTCRRTTYSRANSGPNGMSSAFAGNRVGVFIAINVIIRVHIVFFAASSSFRCHGNHSIPLGKKGTCPFKPTFGFLTNGK